MAVKRVCLLYVNDDIYLLFIMSALLVFKCCLLINHWCACREKPLAMYIFSKDKAVVDRILTHTSSGGAVVNDTLMHLSCESSG